MMPAEITRWHRLEWVGVVLLLLLAAWLRWRAPLEVPPGLEMDPLIEAQIAEQVLGGDWRPFYEAGQGREGLYHYWLALWLATLGKHVFTLRMGSTFLSLLGLAVGYVLARRLFGPAVALVALAGGAVSLWTLFAARSGLRSTSLPPLAGLAGYFLWRSLIAPNTQHATRNTQYVSAAICLGLSLYTHTAARVLPAVFVLFVLYLLAFHRSWLRGQWGRLALGAGIAVLIALPLLAYLHAHPEADQFEFLNFNRPLAALEAGNPEPALQTSLATLGMFAFRGDPLIFDNVPGRPVFEPLGGALFLVGAAIAVRRLRQPAYAFALIWLLVGLVPGMLSQPAPNFYRTVEAQAIAFAFPGIAVMEAWRWLRRRWPQRVVQPALVGGLALLLGLNLVWNFRDYFVVWPTVEGVPFFWQTALAETARYLDRSPDTSPVVLCTGLTYEHDPWWRPAWQSMRYLLRRDDLAIRYYDCRSAFVLTDGPARYAFPDIADPAEVLPPAFHRDWLAAAKPISDGLPADAGVMLRLDAPPEGLLPGPGPVWWAPEAGGGTPLSPPYEGRGVVRLPVNFGHSLAFLGYDLSPVQARPGERLQVLTAWEVLATPPPRLALFTHVLADPQTLVTQQDGLGLTSHSLRPGDRFVQLHDQITLPPDLPPGEYLLSIGLYSTDTMERLLVYDGAETRGDRLFLGPVEVVAP